jgi:predicted nucleotidyltransferase
MARPGSFVDAAILFEDDPPLTLDGLHLDLADELTGAVGRPADLLALNRASADLVHRVLRDGVLLLDRDPPDRVPTRGLATSAVT